MKNAFAAVLRHNNSKMESLGYNYSLEEFEKLDPMRAKVFATIYTPGLHIGAMEAWTRGEDIDTGEAFLVRYNGHVWLEVSNGGGGACTTAYLQNKFPDLGWVGTEGKPDGFMNSPVIKKADMRSLLANFDSFVSS